MATAFLKEKGGAFSQSKEMPTQREERHVKFVNLPEKDDSEADLFPSK
jgi:hypothetical protein